MLECPPGARNEGRSGRGQKTPPAFSIFDAFDTRRTPPMSPCTLPRPWFLGGPRQRPSFHVRRQQQLPEMDWTLTLKL